MRLFLIVALLLELSSALPSHYHSCTFNFTGGKRLEFPFCNQSLPIETRLRDLLQRMTYEEKCAALDTSNPPIDRLGVASMTSSESTHGVMTGCGRPSGPNSTGCPTSFPSGTGLGASFNRDLWSLVGRIIGTEARGLNNQANVTALGAVPGLPTGGPSGLYFLDPNINLCRDPRWGRCQADYTPNPNLSPEPNRTSLSRI